MYKKILCIVLILLTLLSITACSKSEPNAMLVDKNGNSIVFDKYSPDTHLPFDVEIPSNYIETAPYVYAVLNENNEIVSYKKLIFQADTKNYVFEDCDENGNLIETPTTEPPTTEPPTTEPPIVLKSITLNKTELTLTVGSTSKVFITPNPEDYDISAQKWESSNEKVATIKNGTITAVATGSAEIKVTLEDKVAVCKVTVKAKTPEVIKTTGIKISKSSLSLTVGDTSTITAEVSPSNATDKKVTWTSSNTKVATVSNGKITAKGEGTATITAKTSGGQTKTCTVTVKKKTVATTGISLSKKEITIYIGESATLATTISPSNATNKTVKWSSSNGNIASVNNGKITANSVGTVTITAKASGGQTATCKVTVIKKEEAFAWRQITQADCPLKISQRFDPYIVSNSVANVAFTQDGYTYILIKATAGKKVSVSSVKESGGKIVIDCSTTGTSNYVIIRINRLNTNFSLV